MQTKAVTSDVTIYGIPKQGKMQKAFQLIDIPGLGDTNGVKRDNLNINLISKKI